MRKAKQNGQIPLDMIILLLWVSNEIFVFFKKMQNSKNE